MSGIKKSIKSSKLKSLNILDVGYQLHSDFNLKNELDRHKTREAIEEYLKSLSNEAELFVDTGSIFSFPYSDKITNIPSDHSGYKIEDTAIPFYQIVISGYLPYSAPSINSAPDSETAFLKAVEYGAQLQYTWICKKPENVLRIREDYYGFLYSDFIESAKEYINSYKELYSSIEGSSITEHIIYSDELTKTVYDNGIAVLVNYGDEVIEADGRQIEPKSFCLIGGEVQ